MHSFFECFFPKLQDVLIRDGDFWAQYGYVVGPIQAKLYNFCCVDGGIAEMELNGKVYALKAGQAFHFAPGDQLHIRSARRDPLRYTSVHFYHYPLIWEGLKVQVAERVEALPFDRVVHLQSVYATVQIELQALHALWTCKQGGYEWRSRQKFVHVLQHLVEHLDSRLRREDGTVRLVLETMRYIQEHYAAALDRDQLARMASLSASYYSTLFKKYAGYPPMEYLHKLRLDRAKELLRGTNAPVSTIAREVGYRDPLYFTRLFAKEIGMSPRKFRNG
ncbi:helix-turn-helix transcriptional regulator [Paenibacillus sp. IB182496]|uniref:Helix-turn-helix transcriptional regulator n=1 Tax=Paenibacillus sabuli TaxID=2772509 RepID=A0A927GQY3_9BACL|nr:AraC family transcriptional regulator [Paenibacillus sabuli]MBD2845024.1 helix-turn-helix transcriptional regulator [Paenibacillus sabuli]